MNEWLTLLDINSVIMGLLAGLIIALIGAMITAKVARRKGAEAEYERLQPVNETLEASLKDREEELSEFQRELAITETRLEQQQQHHQRIGSKRIKWGRHVATQKIKKKTKIREKHN